MTALDGRAWVAIVVAAFSLSVARAQLDAFDAQYRAAEALRGRADAGDSAAVAAVRRAYRDALKRFLSSGPEEDGYDGRLAAAGWCAVQIEDWRQANALLEQAEQRGGGSDFVAGTRLRALCAAGRGNEALDLARRHAEAWPVGTRRALIQEGLLFSALLPVADRALRRGRTEAGLWAFRYAARELPKDGPTQANLGLALRNLGRLAEAEASYRRALELAPKDHTTWNDLGLLLKGQGRYEAAAEALLRSFALDPEPPTGPATTNLVILEGRLGRALLPDSTKSVSNRLAMLPGGAMATRVLLDRLLGRTAAPSEEKPSTAASVPEAARRRIADTDASTR